MSKKIKDKEIGFRSLSRRYWREQLFFYAIATVSRVLSFSIEDDIKKIMYHHTSNVFSLLPDMDSKVQTFNWRSLFIIFTVIGFYFVAVAVHVWYAFYLQSKIRDDLKKRISDKLFRLKNYTSQDKELVSSLLNNNVKSFSEYVFFLPNQLYYVLLDIVLKGVNLFRRLRSASRRPLSFFVQYAVALLFICFLLQLSFYVQELTLQEILKSENKAEMLLADHRDLIIKKGSVQRTLNDYHASLGKTLQNANKRDVSQTLAFVFSSYFMIKLFPFLALFLVAPSNLASPDIILSIKSFYEVFENVRKLIERSRQFPFSVSSQKRINKFLARSERDDLQAHLVVPEKVQSIVFKNISFQYPASQKTVLKNFSMSLRVGQVNRLDFPNGFGKSTIISLLFGLVAIQDGQIIINERYKLSELDLQAWRTKIVYSEHRNLVMQDNLSTGQKQLIDLQNSLQLAGNIYIFDEADSNLDAHNKEYFLQEVEKLSEHKLVILIMHETLAAQKK